MASLILLGVAGLFAAGTESPLELPEGFILVAHRGVVDDTFAANSLPSLEETIRRGYTHFEVDLQCTRDGHAVCCHDRSLGRTAGVRGRINDMTLAELRQAVSENLVPSFETFCQRCEGRINLMPDVKACPSELRSAFLASIESSLADHGLMREALFIGRADITRHFEGKGRLAWGVPLEAARSSARAKKGPRNAYFIFRHAADLDAAQVAGFHEMGLQVVVSINTFHYKRVDPIEQGRRDIRRMIALGVDGLQIDSVYDDLVLPGAPRGTRD